MEVQKDLYLCFIDYQKAFDNVKHEKLFQILEKIGLDGKDLRVLRNLYWKQTATIRVDGSLGRWVEIKKGTRQGCVLSPDLYNLYSEYIMRKIEGMEGIKVGGVNVNNLRYADDTTLIADSNSKLQKLLNAVVQESEKLGLKINEKKTFCMVVTNKKIVPACRLQIKGKPVQQIEQFTFLGSLITSNGKSEQEIKRRVAIAKTAFQNMKNVLTSRHINISTRSRILRCYVLSTMLYGCETWTVSKEMQNKIEAAEMWFLRRMLRISWIKKKTNDEVLKLAGMERSLLKAVKKKQLEFFGHVMRKRTIENLVTTGKINGKRARGRPRLKYVESMCEGLGRTITPNELIHLTYDRVRWSLVIANVVDDRAR
jgi:hypothetical protein